ncbi:40S ribosomal protein S20, partial [Lemmus lemmus]
RITLPSCNVKLPEKVCADLIRSSKEKNPKDQVCMPTKTLRITTRKTPRGEGSKIWDGFQMVIQKLEQITSISIEPGMEIKVTIADV